MQIGILALQGAVAEHKVTLSKLGVKVLEVRLPRDLEEIDAIVLPGGESTTVSKLLLAYSLLEPLRIKIQKGLPVLGTCAGVILLAKTILGDGCVNNLGILNITVRRNAYGRQINSFEVDLDIPYMGEGTFPGIFIRAPIIESVNKDVDVLGSFNDNPVAVRQGKLIGCTFHPELTNDIRFHQYFLSIV